MGGPGSGRKKGSKNKPKPGAARTRNKAVKPGVRKLIKKTKKAKK